MEAFLGMIALFPYSFTPENWLDCDGRELPIRSNEALYSLLGTAFGGNGTTTFCLPDLRGRSPIGVGSSPLGNYKLGQVQGQNATAISTTTLTLPATTAAGSSPVKVNNTTEPLNVKNPTLALRWCICTMGMYPSRP